ncbi:MAG: ComF family protein [Chloroflexota bacterium]|nr:ComF family protein [Chloroflexota bacterium]
MEISFVELIYRAYWTALDWIYPPVCAACGMPGYRLCLECQSKIRFISGRMRNSSDSMILLQTKPGYHDQAGPSTYNAVKTLAIYEGVIRECIHALKYENNQGLGELFSGWLADLVSDEGWEVDLVMPVALSSQRVRQRGYNQSALIARPLAARLHRQYSPFGLKRIRNTPSQVGLSAEERRQNVAGAFSGLHEIVNGMHVLLVDDVLTTGATLEACTSALNAVGAEAVYCVTVAGFYANTTDPCRSP